MDLDVERRRFDLLVEATSLILLDTNAVIWLHRDDRRAAPLSQRPSRLCASPATILELHFDRSRTSSAACRGIGDPTDT